MLADLSENLLDRHLRERWPKLAPTSRPKVRVIEARVRVEARVGA
jgi:hypothetical protein